VAGRRGEPIEVQGARVEGDPHNATAQLIAGWISSRSGCGVEVVESTRTPGSSGVDTISLTLDRNEEVRLQADRRGGAVVTQPNRPESTIALPEGAVGDLVGEELRRLDRDETYEEALESATGVTGLASRSPVREHVWFDPAEENGDGRGDAERRARAPKKASAKKASGS
jgi:glucose-6-phosphate dehydrogenase assembly protein OpcA